jgi:hypothetical protein
MLDSCIIHQDIERSESLAETEKKEKKILSEKSRR